MLFAGPAFFLKMQVSKNEPMQLQKEAAYISRRILLCQ